MDRRRFITLTTVGGAALITGCGGQSDGTTSNAAASGGAVKKAAPGFSFSLNILDGYAYLFAHDWSKLFLAGIDANQMTHKLILRVRAGQPLTTANQMTPETGISDPEYDFSGYDTVLVFNGVATPLRPPQQLALPANLPCPVPPTNYDTWNNLGFLPKATDVYPDPSISIRTDWQQHVHSTFLVDRGAVRVNPGTPGLWHFHTKTETKDRVTQQMSDRVSIEVPASGSSIRLDASKNGKPSFSVEIAPVGGSLVLDLAVQHAIPPGGVTPHPPGKPIEHFGRFRSLFVVKGGDNPQRELTDDEVVLPYLETCPSGEKTPGEFCPFIQGELP